MIFGMPIEDALMYPVLLALFIMCSGSYLVIGAVVCAIWPPTPVEPRRDWG